MNHSISEIQQDNEPSTIAEFMMGLQEGEGLCVWRSWENPGIHWRLNLTKDGRVWSRSFGVTDRHAAQLRDRRLFEKHVLQQLIENLEKLRNVKAEPNDSQS